MTTIVKSDFHAALQNLENMAKAQGATQLYHTASDSDPGSHAGTSTSDYQDENQDGIDENGTDYTGVKKALAMKVEKSQALTPAEVAIVKGTDPRPFIAAKISKGDKLTAAESWVTKGGYDKMMAKGTAKPGSAGTPGEQKDAGSVPETNAGDNNDGDIEEDAKKSLASGIAASKELKKGLEMSGILAEFARAMGSALEGTEARVAQKVAKSLVTALAPVFDRIAAVENTMNKSFANQGEFNKGFADTLVGIGQHVAGNSDIAAAQASQAAAAPKSQFRTQNVQVVAKSFGPGGLPNGQDALNKSQISDVMFELVKSNKLNQLDLIKFETTGEIAPAVQSMVLAHVGQGN